MKNKIEISLILIILIFILSIFVYFGRIILNIDYTQKAFFAHDNYKIIIKGNGPKGLFGGEDLIIYAKNKHYTFKYKTYINNDGKNIGMDNFNVEWDNDVAILTISAEEQKDEYLEINFKTKKINHKKMEYYVEESEDKSPIITPFTSNYPSIDEKEYEYVSYGIAIKDKYGQSVIPYNVEKFIITLDYEIEDGLATKKWYDLGNAYVYKNDKITFIECNNDRDNIDYENLNDNYYKKYITGDSGLEYKYEMCKPNK